MQNKMVNSQLIDAIINQIDSKKLSEQNKERLIDVKTMFAQSKEPGSDIDTNACRGIISILLDNEYYDVVSSMLKNCYDKIPAIFPQDKAEKYIGILGNNEEYMMITDIIISYTTHAESSDAANISSKIALKNFSKIIARQSWFPQKYLISSEGRRFFNKYIMQ